MNLVVDASVALRWFFHPKDDEDHIGEALTILRGIRNGRYALLEPPHFLAEVSAVLARKKPNRAIEDLSDLMEIECRMLTTPALFPTAIALSTRLGHHLFDTLYHATALETPDALLITAERRYFDKAREIGRIQLLEGFELG